MSRTGRWSAGGRGNGMKAPTRSRSRMRWFRAHPRSRMCRKIAAGRGKYQPCEILMVFTLNQARIMTPRTFAGRIDCKRQKQEISHRETGPPDSFLFALVEPARLHANLLRHAATSEIHLQSVRFNDDSGAEFRQDLQRNLLGEDREANRMSRHVVLGLPISRAFSRERHRP